MAVCQWCQRDMLDGTGCTETVVSYPDGGSLPVIKVADLGDFEEGCGSDVKCHDCNAPVGTAHHPGCDAERCPRCKGQLISCGCLDEDELPA